MATRLTFSRSLKKKKEMIKIIVELLKRYEQSISSVDMVSPNKSWSSLCEQLRQCEEIHYQPFPSAPVQKLTSTMNNVVQDEHWIEFDTDFYLSPDQSSIRVDLIKQSFVIVDLHDENHVLKLFDVILKLNEIELKTQPKEIIQSLIDAHRDKHVSMRIRRLQPSHCETIEFHLNKSKKKLGFTIDDDKDSIDPGLFVVGIRARGLAAKHGRLRVKDRLLQITNRYTTVNLQCMELSNALKLIHRMKNESTMVKILVAHQSES